MKTPNPWLSLASWNGLLANYIFRQRCAVSRSVQQAIGSTSTGLTLCTSIRVFFGLAEKVCFVFFSESNLYIVQRQGKFGQRPEVSAR